MDTPGTKPTNSYVSVYNTDNSDELQILKLARNLHGNSRNLQKNSSTLYIRADTMGQENKIQSRHISTDTVCLLRSDKRTSTRMPQQKYSTNELGEIGNDNNHDDFDNYDTGRKQEDALVLWQRLRVRSI